MNTSKTQRRLSEADDDEADEGARSVKAKRHDFNIPSAEVDINLAEKLDKLLSIGSCHRKPKFLTNRTKNNSETTSDIIKNVLPPKLDPTSSQADNPIKLRNLSKEKLKERLVKYDSLLPELDPKRPSVKLIKVLTIKESLELGQREAKRQLEQQMQLNSVSGNRAAQKSKNLSEFKFQDGYVGSQPVKSIMRSKSKSEVKSIKFVDDIVVKDKKFPAETSDTQTSVEDHDSDGYDDDDDDELTDIDDLSDVD